MWVSRGLRVTIFLPFFALLGAQSPDIKPGVPWVQGVGLHLEGEQAWRMQVMMDPAFLPGASTGPGLPAGLTGAAMPTVLVHFKQLRPGLQQLTDLAGGFEGGLLKTASHGPRAGYYLRQAQEWLKNASPALAPLAEREAWVLHYGHDWAYDKTGKKVPFGTALFIPGPLPARSKLLLTFASLNPFSKGVRTRQITWESKAFGSVSVEQVLGLGGTLQMVFRPEGTWITDRLHALAAVLDGEGQRTFALRPAWARQMMGGAGENAQVSLWMIPRLAASPKVEKGLVDLSKRPEAAKVATTLQQAAPLSATASIALGQGPCDALLRACAMPDAPHDIVAHMRTRYPPSMQPSVEDLQNAKMRQEMRQGLRKALESLMTKLDMRCAALSWHGWTPAPPLSEADRALVKKRKTQQLFDGRGEPGMTPSMALAVPIQAGQGAAVDEAMKGLFQRAFRKKLQHRTDTAGYAIHRMPTQQAFFPAWTVAKDVLVLGSDDRAVYAVAEGLLGRAPTLADKPSLDWGTASVEGSKLSKDMESLLLAYLKANRRVRSPWWMENTQGDPTAEEIQAEVTETFGGFLGVLSRQGQKRLSLSWTRAGFEVKPQ